jgi:hypothetical protein
VANVANATKLLKFDSDPADGVCMTHHVKNERRFASRFLAAAVCSAAVLTLAGCGGGSDAAYSPPITAAAGRLPDRLALQEVADSATVETGDRTVCQLYRQIVSGTGPADPTAVRREFGFEYSLLLQVAEIDFVLQQDVQVYLSTMAAQMEVLKGNGWNMLDPRVLGAYQTPEYVGAIGRIQVWGASQCGVLAPEDGLLEKLSALLGGGASTK